MPPTTKALQYVNLPVPQVANKILITQGPDMPPVWGDAPPGPQGPTGPTGVTGPKGDPGADGAQVDGTTTPAALALVGTPGVSSKSAPADHVHAHPAQFVSSIAALRTLGKPSVSFAYARVTGYYADGDGGGGKFTWFPSSSLSDDGGAVINPSGNSGNGRWLRNILVNNLNVKWWGAKGKYNYPTDATDDYAAFAATLAYIDRVLGIVGFPAAYKVYVPTGDYRLSQNLIINRPIDMYGDGINSSNLHFVSTDTGVGDPMDGIILNRSSNMEDPVSNYDASGAIVRDMNVLCSCGITGGINPSLPLYNEYDPLTSTTTGHSYLPGNGVAILAHGCWVARCFIGGFRFDGVHVEAIAGSDNANDFRVVDCTINQNGRHAIYAAGDNGNAGYAYGCDINNNAGWGIYDRSFLGNYYGTHQTAVNGSVVQDSLAVLVEPFGTPRAGQATSQIWIGSKNGGVYKSSRDNTAWRSINIGLQNPTDATGDNAARIPGICALAVDTASGTRFAAAGAVNAGILPGGVYWTNDATSADVWNQSNSGLTNLDVRALAWGNSVLLAGTVGGGIFKSTDDAATWTASGMTTGNVRALIYDPNNVGTFYAATDTGVYKSTDSGATWTAINTGLTTVTTLSLAIAPDSSAVYAGASDGTLYESTDGSTWSLAFTEGGAHPIQGIAVMVTDATKVFAATGGAGMYVSTNSGATWTQSNSGLVDTFDANPILDVRAVTTDQFGVAYIAPIGNVYSTREENNGGAYRSLDGGATWQFIAAQLEYGGSYSAVGGVSAQCVFDGCYSEGGQNIWVPPPAVVMGGVLCFEARPPDDDWPVNIVGGSGISGSRCTARSSARFATTQGKRKSTSPPTTRSC